MTTKPDSGLSNNVSTGFGREHQRDGQATTTPSAEDASHFEALLGESGLSGESDPPRNTLFPAPASQAKEISYTTASLSRSELPSPIDSAKSHERNGQIQPSDISSLPRPAPTVFANPSSLRDRATTTSQEVPSGPASAPLVGDAPELLHNKPLDLGDSGVDAKTTVSQLSDLIHKHCSRVLYTPLSQMSGESEIRILPRGTAIDGAEIRIKLSQGQAHITFAETTPAQAELLNRNVPDLARTIQDRWRRGVDIHVEMVADSEEDSEDVVSPYSSGYPSSRLR